MIDWNNNIRWTERTDEGVGRLGRKIGMYIFQLVSLSLNFSGYLTNNQCLFNLVSCVQITDKGVEVLGTEIGRHLLQLQQLILNFNGYLTNNQCLFNLVSCYQITDKGVEVLAIEIASHLSYLQSFTIRVPMYNSSSFKISCFCFFLHKTF